MADADKVKLDANKVHQKLKLAGELYQFALKVKITQLKVRHPGWSDEQLKCEAQKLIDPGRGASLGSVLWQTIFSMYSVKL